MVGQLNGRYWLGSGEPESELQAEMTGSESGWEKATTLPPHNIEVAGSGRLAAASIQTGRVPEGAWLEK